MKQTAIYAGTFDPITNGHLNIIERSARLFDNIIVAVANNPNKQPLFSLEQRVALVEQSCQHLPNVQAVGFSNLLAQFADEQNATILIRGLRGGDDIDYEIQLSQLNTQLNDRLETVFLPPSIEWRHLSSTLVRDIYRHHGDVQKFVPDAVFQALRHKNG